jgi:microcystin-dependent protein
MSNKIKPTDNIHFSIINKFTNKKNELYVQDGQQAQSGNLIALKIESKKTVEFYTNGLGNANTENYTFALVFPIGVLDNGRLNQIQLIGKQALNWNLFAEEDHEQTIIYLLAKSKDLFKDQVPELLIQQLPITDAPSKASNVELRYKTKANSSDVFCSTIAIGIFNHTGVENCPFKLVLDTPLLSISDTLQDIQIRLINITNADLDITHLRLQLVFDVFESLIKSSEALMPEVHFNDNQFKLPSISFHHKKELQFTKNKNSKATLFQGVLDFNANGTNLKSKGASTSLKRHEQLIIQLKGVKTYTSPGVSPIKLNYYNISGYWDGELTTKIRRTAVYENDQHITFKREISSDLHIKGNITIDQNLNVQNATVKRNLSVQNELTSTGNISTKSKLQENHMDLIPSGSIVMWSGSNIPSGWTLCNGSDYHIPDLRDKFIVGSGGKYAIGKTGGKEQIMLTEDEMPQHNHTGKVHDKDIVNSGNNREKEYKVMHPDTYNWSFDSGSRTGYDRKSTSEPVGLNWCINFVHNHDLTINNTGKSAPHENRPPYYALTYIMKL